MGCGLTIENVNCKVNALITRADAADAALAAIGSVLTDAATSGASVALTTGDVLNVADITLTEGTWLLFGVVHQSLTGASTTLKQASISTTTAALGTDDALNQNEAPTTTLTGVISLIVPTIRVVVAAGQTDQWFLVTKCTFSAGSAAAFGTLTAVRVG